MAHKNKNNTNLYIQVAAILIAIFMLAVVLLLKTQSTPNDTGDNPSSTENTDTQLDPDYSSY